MGTAERTAKARLRRVAWRLQPQKEGPGVKALSGTG